MPTTTYKLLYNTHKVHKLLTMSNRLHIDDPAVNGSLLESQSEVALSLCVISSFSIKRCCWTLQHTAWVHYTSESSCPIWTVEHVFWLIWFIIHCHIVLIWSNKTLKNSNKNSLFPCKIWKIYICKFNFLTTTNQDVRFHFFHIKKYNVL